MEGKKNTAFICGKGAVILSVQTTSGHISAQKTAITAMVSPHDRDFSELSPRKKPPSLRV